MKLLADGEDTAIIELGDIAEVAGSAAGELLVGALAAAAAGAALDVPAATIRQVLTSRSEGSVSGCRMRTRRSHGTTGRSCP